MTSPSLPADLEGLIAPVAPGTPAGADLRYQPIYDEIKAARRLAEASPTEKAQWKKVVELVTKAFLRSRDLQLAIWLLEGLSRLDAFRGATTGLMVTRRLVDEQWDSVYPQVDPEDGDPLGFRRALLLWINEKLPQILKSAPLTGPPSSFGLVHYEVTQRVGDEKKALLEEGWPTFERIDEALTATATSFLQNVLEELTACETELATLQASVESSFTVDPPTFTSMKEALATGRWLIERPLKKRQPAGSGGGSLDPASTAGTATEGPRGGGSASSGDEVWGEALSLIRGSRVDGLRLLQAHLANADSGRERFLRQLQLAELSLEAGMHTLAYPLFDELARIIEARALAEWEDASLVRRVWSGLDHCCDLLKGQSPAAAVRQDEIRTHLSRPRASSPASA